MPASIRLLWEANALLPFALQVWTDACDVPVNTVLPQTKPSPPPGANAFTNTGLDFKHAPNRPRLKTMSADRQAVVKGQHDLTRRLVSQNVFRARTIIAGKEPLVTTFVGVQPTPLASTSTKKRPASATGEPSTSKPAKAMKLRVASIKQLRKPPDDQAAKPKGKVTRLSGIYESRAQPRSMRGAFRALHGNQAMHCHRPLPGLVDGLVTAMRFGLKTYTTAMADLFFRIFLFRNDNKALPRLLSQAQVVRMCQTMAYLLRECPADAETTSGNGQQPMYTPSSRRKAYEKVIERSDYLDAHDASLLVDALLEDATIQHAFTDRGEGLKDVDLYMLLSVHSVLGRQRLPPLCNLPAFSKLWDELAANYATCVITSAKETMSETLTNYVTLVFGKFDGVEPDWYNSMSVKCKKGLVTRITNAVFSSPLLSGYEALMPRSLTPELLGLVNMDLADAEITADLTLIIQRVTDVFNMVIRECNWQSIQVPPGITLGMVAEGKNGGSPLQMLRFVHFMKVKLGKPFGIAQVSRLGFCLSQRSDHDVGSLHVCLAGVHSHPTRSHHCPH